MKKGLMLGLGIGFVCGAGLTALALHYMEKSVEEQEDLINKDIEDDIDELVLLAVEKHELVREEEKTFKNKVKRKILSSKYKMKKKKVLNKYNKNGKVNRRKLKLSGMLSKLTLLFVAQINRLNSKLV